MDMICEAHPELEWPHDDCAGPGMPTSARVGALVYQRDEALKRAADAEARIAALTKALTEALDEWADASDYKGDYLSWDREHIKELRALAAEGARPTPQEKQP